MRSRDGRILAGDDDGAASGVIAFMVAGVIFVSAVGGVLFTTRGVGGTAAADDLQASTLRVQARDVASILLGSPGFAVGGDWAEDANPFTGQSAQADRLLRLGLLDDQEADPTMLEFAKFQNLRRAPLRADASDGYVNYEEATRSLGLAGLDFHVRAYPQLAGLGDVLGGQRDPNLRVTYIGHYEISYPVLVGAEAPPSPTYMMDVAPPTCAVSNDVSAAPGNTPPQGNPAGAAQNYRLQTVVTNGGSTPTQFTALFTYQLGSYQGTRVAQSYIVPAGQPTTLFVDIPARSGVACSAGSQITVKVSEPFGNSVTQSATLATGVTGATSLADMKDLYLQAGSSVYTTSTCTSAVELTWSSPSNDVGANDFLAMKVVRSADGAPVWPADGDYHVFKGNSGQKAKLDNICLEPGQYRGYLYYSGGNSFTATSQHVVSRILVHPTSVPGYVAPGLDVTDWENPIYQQQPPVAVEVGFLNGLVERFCPAFYNTPSATRAAATPLPLWDLDADGVGDQADWNANGAIDGADTWSARCGGFAAYPATRALAQQGDVIPDFKRDMDNNLPERLLYPADANGNRLPRYDITQVLVVGSNVDHTAMTSGAAKFAVRDWVLGGGSLIVFGSDEGNVNWLEPLFHAAIRSSSGGIHAPDIGHPILHTPNELDNPAETYDARGQSWNFNGQTARAQEDEASALFTNVIVAGNALTGNPLLADSRPGAVGSGSIILTSYLPYDVYNSPRSSLPAGPACPGLTLGECEGMKLVHNLMMSSYGDLYLDYGPECPPGANCVPAVRSAQIRHPDFADPIWLKLNVFVF